MHKVPLLVLVALGVVLSQTLSQFTADVLITNKPGLYGNLNGKFYFNGTLMRITYALGPNEYFNFPDDLRYLTCGTTCEAETITYDAPIFRAQSGEETVSSITVGGRTCVGYIRTSAGDREVEYRYVSGDNLCRVVYGDGTTYTFTDNAPLPSDWYNPPTDDCAPYFSCGPGCRGFCSCDGQCVCPDSCDDDDACTDDICRIGGNGNGCIHTPTTCNDENACTQNKCDPLTGCDFTEPTVCDDHNACTENLCNPMTGCYFPGIICDDINPCTVNKCFPATGCDFTEEIPGCDQCKDKPPCLQGNCIVSTCNVLTGTCEESPLNCDDNNECTIDSCDLDSGQCIHTAVNCDDDNACTIDTCDPQIGCIHTPINVLDYCDDGNACTTDTCDPVKGCVNTPIVCDDNDPCTTNECSSLFGCFYDPLDCRTTPEFAGRDLGDCHVVICDPTQPSPCVLQLLPNMTEEDCKQSDSESNPESITESDSVPDSESLDSASASEATSETNSETNPETDSEPLDISAAAGIGGLIVAVVIVAVVTFM